MQIGGPKYPKKRRINLYQKQVKKGKIAAELGVFVVFMGLVYGFSQFGVVRLLRKADQAEAVYAEADPDARYVTASLEETVQKEGEERVLAASKPVGVSMTVFFNVPEEDGEKQ